MVRMVICELEVPPLVVSACQVEVVCEAVRPIAAGEKGRKDALRLAAPSRRAQVLDAAPNTLFVLLLH
eukprot:6187854-Pleurochrysis_carterae.AAC.2